MESPLKVAIDAYKEGRKAEDEMLEKFGMKVRTVKLEIS